MVEANFTWGSFNGVNFANLLQNTYLEVVHNNFWWYHTARLFFFFSCLNWPNCLRVSLLPFGDTIRQGLFFFVWTGRTVWGFCCCLSLQVSHNEGSNHHAYSYYYKDQSLYWNKSHILLTKKNKAEIWMSWIQREGRATQLCLKSMNTKKTTSPLTKSFQSIYPKGRSKTNLYAGFWLGGGRGVVLYQAEVDFSGPSTNSYTLTNGRSRILIKGRRTFTNS